MIVTRVNPNRRRLSFSLRTLLILVTILCVGLGWKMYQVRNLRRAVAEVRRLGGDITYVHQLDHAPPVEPPGPKLLRCLLGDDFFVEVNQIQLYKDRANDDTLAFIAKLPRIDSLIVKSDGITNRGLAYLAQASELKALEIHSSKVTASGYAQLKGLNKLMTLVLADDATVADSWLSEIAKLKQIHYLFLDRTKITDEGTILLQGHSNLRKLGLTETKVTKQGVEKLQRSLPNCQIAWP